MSVKAKKHLGQHFLKDEAIAKNIADALTENGYNDVLEIGPGMGVLTKYLLKKKPKITVMELDRESVAYLHDTFPLEHIKLDTSKEKFEIIEGDFLKKNIQDIFNKKQVAIIGNFPYNISTQIVFKAIENREFVPEFAGMFQKEVAKRIAEKEGSKVYGILSVLTQAFFEVEYLFTVPPSVFNPPPKVDSGVIRFIRKKDYSLPVDEKIFFRVVKTAFNQRRKMLRSSLKSFNLSDSLKEDPIFAKRPEQLSVAAFISLTQKLIEKMAFEITDEFLENLSELIISKNDTAITALFSEVHFADIAEVLDEVNFDEAIYIIKLLDSEKTSEILTELDEDTREKILENLSAKEIAEEVEEMDSDDAADIIGELSEERQQRVINALKDDELAADIKELLSYEDNTAGALMAKELVKVYETWTVAGCMRRIRGQAKEVTRVHSIYVVDKEDKLVGRLSLKDLIIAKSDQKIADISKAKVDAVNVSEDDEEVAKIMAKYDLEAIPVVDNNNVLLGRITIDDIVDVLKEEADKDYQMAAGLTQDVDSDDSIFELTKARLPWLFLGLIGGVGAFIIMEGFQNVFSTYKTLFFFTPLIAAMAGNVGVQSSAIIVQGLANDDVKGSINSRLFKEMLLAALNGVILAIFLFFFVWAYKGDINLALAISASLIIVIIVAGLIGTFVPLFLNKRGIDPAIATGPFITTSNDIFGILIYFMIAKLILVI